MRRSVTEPAAARARDPPGLAIIDLDRSTGLDCLRALTSVGGDLVIAAHALLIDIQIQALRVQVGK